MKITYTRSGTFETHYTDSWDLDIDPELFEQIQSGQHPDYADIEDWASEHWAHNTPPTRSVVEQGDVYEGDTEVKVLETA